MIYCVALTGNIASGKSTAMSCFKSLGIPVIYADKIAKDLTAKGKPAFLAIKEKLGTWFLTAEGELNRAALRRRILYNPSDRLWLENLLHPLIQQAIEAEVMQLKNALYCVIEIPLLFNCDDYPYVNRVLVILSDRETQIERLMERDGCDYEEAESLLLIQPDEKSRRSIADDLLTNNSSIDDLRQSIKHLHKKYQQFVIDSL